MLERLYVFHKADRISNQTVKCPSQKAPDSRIQKVGVIIPNLRALPQNEKPTPISPVPSPPVLPEQQFVGLIIQIYTLNDGSTITIYKQNENQSSYG